MKNTLPIKDLLAKMKKAEESFAQTNFIAPVVRPGSKVTTRIDGIVCSYSTKPADFVGWGKFSTGENNAAVLNESADMYDIADYLKLFPALRCRLVAPIADYSVSLSDDATETREREEFKKFRAWMAVPVNYEEAERRFGREFTLKDSKHSRQIELRNGTANRDYDPDNTTRRPGRVSGTAFSENGLPNDNAVSRDATGQSEYSSVSIVVRLVEGGNMFDSVIVRLIGKSNWVFDSIDYRADVETADVLRALWNAKTLPGAVKFSGKTPEAGGAYDSAWAFAMLSEARKKLTAEQRDRLKILESLNYHGAELIDYTDRGTFWQIQWQTASGERHNSAVNKDMSVVSSGICLSGEDRKFDLKSLVPVIEKRYDDEDYY